MPDTLSEREVFVGRGAELVTFRQALTGGPAAPVMLYLHGPARIGKSALLRRFAAEAQADGRPVVAVDGHAIAAAGSRSRPRRPRPSTRTGCCCWWTGSSSARAWKPGCAPGSCRACPSTRSSWPRAVATRCSPTTGARCRCRDGWTPCHWRPEQGRPGQE
ncbi:ATP-binding protein [Amycolatopsis acidiphila]|uniref:ATP-binding protein n=1 Tax=Amycolatopsis acidiphila TaxID=715473 RepID=A0A558ACS8_9PSEU|nr:ATP-binding protein [Amycolatopsis acidiphila]